MSQPSDSHLIANEVKRLKQMPRQEAARTLGARIDRTFEILGGGGSRFEFYAELDFNARLVTMCRQRGVIWHQSR